MFWVAQSLREISYLRAFIQGLARQSGKEGILGYHTLFTTQTLHRRYAGHSEVLLT
jgi:hypothetical protein